MQALVAEVAGRRFALPLRLVRKVLPAVAVTPIPNLPAAVEGVVEIRGEVHAVVSAARALGLGEGPLAADHHFVLARLGKLLVALHVDRALDVVDLAESGFVAMSSLVPGSPSFKGALARAGDGLVLVNDLPAFLSFADAQATEAALTSGSLA